MIKCPQCGYEFEPEEKKEALEETTKEDTEQVQKCVETATKA
jgi:rubredoxin